MDGNLGARPGKHQRHASVRTADADDATRVLNGVRSLSRLEVRIWVRVSDLVTLTSLFAMTRGVWNRIWKACVCRAPAPQWRSLLPSRASATTVAAKPSLLELCCYHLQWPVCAVIVIEAPLC